MAYTKNEKGDAPKMRRGDAEERKFAFSVAKRITRSITKMLLN